LPEILGAGHIALTVRNIETSALWYEAVFGWPMVRLSVADDGTFLRTLSDPHGSLALSLCASLDRSGDAFDSRRTGLDHVAFRALTRKS
jgi:glyoxylase I family protein